MTQPTGAVLRALMLAIVLVLQGAPGASAGSASLVVLSPPDGSHVALIYTAAAGERNQIALTGGLDYGARGKSTWTPSWRVRL